MKRYADFGFFGNDFGLTLMSLNIKSIIIFINSEFVRYSFSSYCSILFAWLNLSKTSSFKLIVCTFYITYVYYINLYLSKESLVESHRNLALKPLSPDKIARYSICIS